MHLMQLGLNPQCYQCPLVCPEGSFGDPLGLYNPLLRASYAADELKALLAYCPLDGQRRPAAGLTHLMRRHVVA